MNFFQQMSEPCTSVAKKMRTIAASPSPLAVVDPPCAATPLGHVDITPGCRYHIIPVALRVKQVGRMKAPTVLPACWRGKTPTPHKHVVRAGGCPRLKPPSQVVRPLLGFMDEGDDFERAVGDAIG